MIIALCDCNNFFVSCERVRNPSLEGRPVIVLSNNDGCVVSRSNEAKALDIGMAVPFFTIRGLARHHDIVVLSGDHELYRDLSRKVMSVLREMVPEVEVSSIDEAYLRLTGIHAEDPEAYCRRIRREVRRRTGIPVSIGIAGTKTLAKAASWFAKKRKELGGVLDLRKREDADDLMAMLEISEVWGIGRRSADKLRRRGIRNARDLKYADASWMERHLSVNVLRTIRELQGFQAIPFREKREPRKSIQVAPSFPASQRSLDVLREALIVNVSEAAAGLRREELLAATVSISLSTDRFRKDLPQYFCSTDVQLAEPTSCTSELVRAAREGLDDIYRRGYAYRKVGIILSNLSPADASQMHLFGKGNSEKDRKLMETVDAITGELGKDSLWLAGGGRPGGQDWRGTKNLKKP